MSSKKNFIRGTLLHTCAHHLDIKSVIASVILLEECVEVKCYEPRTRSVWSQRVSLCHISSMIQSFHSNLLQLWDLLARCMQLVGDDLVFSTQHIIYFSIVTSSAQTKALHIYEITKVVNDTEVWIVDFYSEFSYPFVLEISVKRDVHSSHRHTCRIESSKLTQFFLTYLEMYPIHQTTLNMDIASINSNAKANKGIDGELIKKGQGKETNHMLNAILDDLIYDEATDTLMVRCIEVMKLEEYLVESEGHNSTRKVLQPTPLDMTLIEGDDSDSATHFDSSNPAGECVTERDNYVSFTGDTPTSYTDSKESRYNFKNSLTSEASSSDTTPRPMYHLGEAAHHFDANYHTPMESSVVSPLTSPQRSRISSRVSSARQSPVVTRPPSPVQPIWIEPDVDVNSKVAYVRSRKVIPDPPPVTEPPSRRFTSPSGRASRISSVRSSPKAVTDGVVEGGKAERRKSVTFSGIDQLKSLGTDGGGGDNYEQELYLSIDTTRDLKPHDPNSNSPRVVCDIISTPRLTAPMPSSTDSSNDHVITQKYLVTIDVEKECNLKIDKLMKENQAQIKQSYKQSTIMLKNILNENSFTKNRGSGGGDEYSSLQAEKLDLLQTKYFMVREALSVHADKRSEMSVNNIIEFFKHHSELSKYVQFCSNDDLLSVVRDSVLKDFNKSEVLAVCSETVQFVYLVLQGDLTVTTRDYSFAQLDDSEQTKKQKLKQKYSSQSSKAGSSNVIWGKELTSRVCRPGDLLGDVLMNGLYQWDTDAATYQSTVEKTLSLCCIPAETVLRYIGRGGNEAKDYMSCFWRYTRLFHTLQRYNRQYILSSISQASTRKALNNDVSLMNVIDSARVRTFQAGVNIFAQDAPRSHFYLIISGCCSYVRHLPEWLNKYNHKSVSSVSNSKSVSVNNSRKGSVTSDPQTITTNTNTNTTMESPRGVSSTHPQTSAAPTTTSPLNSNYNEGNAHTQGSTHNITAHNIYLPTEIDTGIRLSSGDFSFLDSESVEFISHMNEQDDFILQSKKDSNVIYEYKMKKYSRFKVHKNSLYTLTRTEVIVIPIYEVVKSVELLQGLLQLANSKYPVLSQSNEHFLREYYKNAVWETDKQIVLQNVMIDRLSSKLQGEFYVNPKTNLSSEYYDHRHPGNRIKALTDNLNKLTHNVHNTAVKESADFVTLNRDAITNTYNTNNYTIHDANYNTRIVDEVRKRPQSAPSSSGYGQRRFTIVKAAAATTTPPVGSENTNGTVVATPPSGKIVFGYGSNSAATAETFTTTASDSANANAASLKLSPRPPSAPQPSRLVVHRPSSANSTLNGRRPSTFTTIAEKGPVVCVQGHQANAPDSSGGNSPRATSPYSHRRSTLVRPHSANTAVRNHRNSLKSNKMSFLSGRHGSIVHGSGHHSPHSPGHVSPPHGAQSDEVSSATEPVIMPAHRMGIQLSLNSVVQAIYLSSVARNEHGGTNDNIAPTSGTSTKTSFMSTTVDEEYGDDDDEESENEDNEGDAFDDLEGDNRDVTRNPLDGKPPVSRRASRKDSTMSAIGENQLRGGAKKKMKAAVTHRKTRVNNLALTPAQLKDPEFFVQLYKQRLVTNSPKQRFIDEISKKR